MNALRQRFKLWNWIALLAIWGLVVLPTLSQAFTRAVQPDGLPANVVEICSAHGIQRINLDTGEVQTEQTVASSATHCAFCGLGAPLAADLPPAPTLTLLALAHEGPPPLFFHAARTLQAWRSAQPRAPPVILN